MDKIQQRALETWYKPDDQRRFDRMHPTLKLAGEAGEFADLHGKHCYKPGFTATDEQYCDELGDVLYYVSILAFQLGVTLDELSQMNYEKLRAREENGTGYNHGIDRACG